MHIRHDIWDVHTDVDRWWVITEPMNLYSQDQFPNMDLALSFHVGLCLRIPRSERQAHDYALQRRNTIGTGVSGIFQSFQHTDSSVTASYWKIWKMNCFGKSLKGMERPIGIEPTPEPWQGSVLPLY